MKFSRFTINYLTHLHSTTAAHFLLAVKRENLKYWNENQKTPACRQEKVMQWKRTPKEALAKMEHRDILQQIVDFFCFFVTIVNKYAAENEGISDGAEERG